MGMELRVEAPFLEVARVLPRSDKRWGQALVQGEDPRLESSSTA
jgi:hypothetical protein